jgi:hypothetical protein
MSQVGGGIRTEAKTEPTRVSRSWSSKYALTNERKAPEEGAATIRETRTGVRTCKTIHRSSGAGWYAQICSSQTRQVYRWATYGPKRMRRGWDEQKSSLRTLGEVRVGCEVQGLIRIVLAFPSN